MADEVVKPITETAPAAVAPATSQESPISAAPAVEAAPAAPAVTTTPAQEPVKTAETAPESSPTPGAEDKPAAAAAATLLGAEPAKPAEEKPADAAKPAVEKPADDKTKPAADAKPADAKKDEGSQSAEPAPLPAYEEFKLPEGVTLKPELVGDFTKILGAFENGPKDHVSTQAFGQALVDKHVSLVKEGIEKVHESYKQTWEKQKTDWLQEFKDDPVLGGNRQDTTVSAAHKFINTHGGSPEEQAEFRSLMEKTGLGNNKIMIRVLANASKNMAEGRMNPGAKPVKEAKNKTQTLYGKSA